MPVKQSIVASQLQMVASRIQSITFSEPSQQPKDNAQGTITINSEYNGAAQQDDDSALYELTMHISVNPVGDDVYYALDITASAVFRPLVNPLAEEDIEAAVLSSGAQGLYERLKAYVRELTRGGMLGELLLPALAFQADKE